MRIGAKYSADMRSVHGKFILLSRSLGAKSEGAGVVPTPPLWVTTGEVPANYRIVPTVQKKVSPEESATPSLSVMT